MKKILYLIPVLLLLFWLSCGDKDDDAPETLEINVEKLEFDEYAGYKYINISSNAKWSVTVSDNSWLECTPNTGTGNDRIKVSVIENQTKNVRNGSITVKTAGGITEPVSVMQTCAAPYIVVQPTSAAPLAAGEDLTVAVSANDEWEINIPAEAQSWISKKSQTATEAVLEVKPNETENDRSTIVAFKLKGSDTKADFSVSQKKIELITTIEIDPVSASVNPEGGDATVNVDTGVEWDVKIPENDKWVTIKSKTNNNIVFSVIANTSGADRSSVIAFETKDGKASTNFTLSQIKGGYTLMSEFNPTQALAGQDPLVQSRSGVNTFLKTVGFDYSENPHCTGGYGGHDDGIHMMAELDATLNQYVFRMDIHIDPVIDGDRCSSSTKDRQRNEMKSTTNNSTWAKVQGNYDEWQILEWKFKLPKGFQPTGSFCHIHQLKAQDGSNNGSPIITITPRASSNGSNRRMQIIHSVDGGTGPARGTVVDNIPLSDFEDEWVQVKEEIHYVHNGYYSCKITRISDGKVLINYEHNDIDMWRKGASYIRSKHGIYRSLAGGDLSKNPVGQSTLLKNESIWLCDFKVYEKNTNPTPGIAHD